MQHLDEGTIHAWLDGALSAEEAARVERHAAECAQCASLVAEARGLVAGATRILSALDDVPAVVPMRPAVLKARPRVPRFSRPGVWAAAASIVVMVGTAIVWNEGVRPDHRGVASSDSRAMQPTLGSADSTAAKAVPLASMPTAGGATTAARESEGSAPPSTDQRARRGVMGGTAASVGTASGRASTERRGTVRVAPAPPAAPTPRAANVPGARDSLARVERRVESSADAAQRVSGMAERLRPSGADAAAQRSPTPEPTRRAAATVSPLRREESVVIADSAVPQQRAAEQRTPARRAAPPFARDGRVAAAMGKGEPAAASPGRTDTIVVSRVDTVTVESPTSPGLRQPGIRLDFRLGSAIVPRGMFAVTGCYEVVEGRLPKPVTLDSTRYAQYGRRGAPRYVAVAPGEIGYWFPEGSAGLRIGIGGALVVARLEPPIGELRGTIYRDGGKKAERFVARRTGCR